MASHFHRQQRDSPLRPTGNGRALATQAQREADREKRAAEARNNDPTQRRQGATANQNHSVFDSPNPNTPPAPHNPNTNKPGQTVVSVKVADHSDLLEQARRDVAAHAEAAASKPYIQSAQVERVFRKGVVEEDVSVTMQNNAFTLGLGQTPASSGGAAGGGATGTAGASGGLFGNAAPSPAAGSSFGNSTQQGSGGFGSKAPASTGAAQSVFSQPATSGGQQKPLFGAVQGGTGGLFSGNNTPTASGFGNASKAASPGTTQPPAIGSLFGNMSTTSPAGTPGEQPKTTGSSLFGKPATTGGSGSGGLFGASTAQAQPVWGFNQTQPSNAGEQSKLASTQSIFATAPTPSATPSSQGLFGSRTPQANKTAQPSTTPAGNPPFSLFGTQANKQTENQQPATSQPQQQGTALFQASAAPASSAAPTSMFSTATPSQPGGPSLFAPKTTAQGQSGTAAPAASTTSNLFGAMNQTPAATPAAPASSTSNLFANLGQNQNAAASSSTAPPATTTTTGSNLFSGGFKFPGAAASSAATSQPAATTTAAPTSAFGGFSLGDQTTGSTPTQPAATSAAPPTFSLNNQASTSGAAASSSTTPATTTAQPSGAAAPSLFSTAAPPSTSTAGPAPPQQSRLASKTMDEILTTWSTSLATHQKTFQQLASRVSAWDRMLVENSGKISTLYGRCFQAERDCAEVERQLGGVEQGQLELEALLERYEGEVEGMMEGAGLGDGGQGAGGVDAERERTYVINNPPLRDFCDNGATWWHDADEIFIYRYQTAEVCSSRLTDMHHSLTDMIEEINSASSNLHSGGQQAQQSQSQSNKTDDPLADIVRVLNAHLSQLQTIDAGASELQGRVAAAQREARGLGESSGRGASWVERFGRSYLGRG
ncbi:hypothetical protein B0A55_03720 [Friedmanniomyces simplex]|uniref:Nucleoporin NSP1 n=1 Tax=Friedmanniomyces simplex TaxID=329884 RepID=A0A4U0XSK9_9PEZI|nr:hypothetical protein B0A55_03720 [Friedmanniomyces simplex]